MLPAKQQLPKINPVSTQSSAGSRLGAREKVLIAQLLMEEDARVREVDLRRELELKKVEAATAIRMQELELKPRATLARWVSRRFYFGF